MDLLSFRFVEACAQSEQKMSVPSRSLHGGGCWGLGHILCNRVTWLLGVCATIKLLSNLSCFQQDLANGTSDYKHDHPIPEAVVDAIHPIFKTLSNKSLLSRCLHGGTHNWMEQSMPWLFWQHATKKTHLSHSSQTGCIYASQQDLQCHIRRSNQKQHLHWWPRIT